MSLYCSIVCGDTGWSKRYKLPHFEGSGTGPPERVQSECCLGEGGVFVPAEWYPESFAIGSGKGTRGGFLVGSGGVDKALGVCCTICEVALVMVIMMGHRHTGN